MVPFSSFFYFFFHKKPLPYAAPHTVLCSPMPIDFPPYPIRNPLVRLNTCPVTNPASSLTIYCTSAPNSPLVPICPVLLPSYETDTIPQETLSGSVRLSPAPLSSTEIPHYLQHFRMSQDMLHSQ